MHSKLSNVKSYERFLEKMRSAEKSHLNDSNAYNSKVRSRPTRAEFIEMARGVVASNASATESITIKIRR